MPLPTTTWLRTSRKNSFDATSNFHRGFRFASPPNTKLHGDYAKALFDMGKGAINTACSSSINVPEVIDTIWGYTRGTASYWRIRS
jgi:hypothetical protein